MLTAPPGFRRGLFEGETLEIFVSDMDGTLLDKNARIPRESEEILNFLAEKGIYFTVATARTPLTADPILRNVRLRLPAVLLNGGMLYDVNEHRILTALGFEPEGIRRIAETEKRVGVCGLLLTVEEGKTVLNLAAEENPLWKGYFDPYKLDTIPSVRSGFVKRSAEEIAGHCVVYGLYMDDRPDRLRKMAHELSAAEELTLDFYKDIYTDDRWCLEITNGNTSKEHGVRQLKEGCGADRVIGFGDGINDLPLFEACDEAYAVSNGCEALKRKADGIIGSNLENGVAVYLNKRYGGT